MIWKKRNAEKLQKRIVNLQDTGMTQSAIAEKIHRSPVYVSRAMKKHHEQLRIKLMDMEIAKEILHELSIWELCLLLRVSARMKNYDAAVCLFNQEHQADIYNLLPFFIRSFSLQQMARNMVWPPKK